MKLIIKNKVNTKSPNLKKSPSPYNKELLMGVMIFKKAIAPTAITITNINTAKTLFIGSLNLFVNLLNSLKIDS